MGRNYITVCTSDYIDSEGVRKVILATKNDREETIAELEIRPQHYFYPSYYDGKSIEDLNRTSTKEIKSGSVISKSYSIRPTFIGNEYFNYIIEELISKEGQKECSLITVDDKNNEISRQRIKTDLHSKKFSVVVEKETVEHDGRYVTLLVKDEDNNVIARQKLQSFTAAKINTHNFSDHYDIFDSNGRRITSVSVKQEKDYVFRSHSLNPKLIGSNYYQQNVNEVLGEDGKNRGMVVTSDENGKVIAREYIDEKLLGEFYNNRISEDYFNENKERVVTIDTINDRDEVVSRKTFKPSVSQQMDDETTNNVVLETVNANGDKTVYYFGRNSQGKQKLESIVKKNANLFVIDEEDNDHLTKSQEHEHKNHYYEDLIKGNQVERNPLRYSDVKHERDEKKNTMLVKDFDREDKRDLKKSQLEKLQETEKREEASQKHDIIQKVLEKNSSEQNLINSLRDSYNLDTKKEEKVSSTKNSLVLNSVKQKEVQNDKANTE